MYILDTDHLTHLAWGESSQAKRLVQRLSMLPRQEVVTTIISYEEQTRGWLAVLAKARTLPAQVEAYSRLERHLGFFLRIPVVAFDEVAATIFSQLQRDRIRLGTMDLRIAATVLAHQSKLLSCNIVDFNKIKGLEVEDWIN